MVDKSKFGLLSQIKYPDNLRHLQVGQLPEVCRELREDIVDELSVNPGHLASSLGVVEITVALHYVFDTPKDRIVWDVGHQAYGHKLLTGRRDVFCTNRKLHGIRPFPSPLESEYDTFTCGHASNSISAALGMAVAAQLNGDDDRRKGIIRLNNALKSALSHQQNIFEGMNIRYFGPFDGHNVEGIVKLLRQLKDMKGPKLLHLHTVKGKGYEPAEKAATIWHAPGKFDAETGERIMKDVTNLPPKFQDVFGETLLELAKQNQKIVGVTPAMSTGCSMNTMMKAIPNRTFDVGIAEGHAVTFSAGMAKDGLQPFCNIYSAFAQRAYDNIIHDTAMLNLPVVLCLDRAGLVGEDGPTHHGAFDMAALRPIPHLTIASPLNEQELRRLMYTAQLPGKGTFIIRYPRGRGTLTDWKCPFEEIEVGTGRKLHDGNDVAVLSIGPIGNDVEKAIEELVSSHLSYSVAHYDMRFLKPLDENILQEVGQKFSHIITIEDGVRNGGLGSAVLEWMNDHGFRPAVTRLGLPDEFVEHGTVAELRQIVGLDTESIKKAITR